MPGYVMHLAEARQVLDKIRGERAVNREEEEQFFVGNLLPDTRLFHEKRYSHFWSEDELEDLAKAPVLELYLNKYEKCLPAPVYMGYLCHLHLDRRYVRLLWPRLLEFYDDEGNPQKLTEKIKYVKALKTGKMVPRREFFSRDYYYGDYTKLNGYFIRRYNIYIPDEDYVKDFSMDEVSLADMRRLHPQMESRLRISHTEPDNELQVFDIETLESFLRDSADEFIHIYYRRYAT